VGGVGELVENVGEFFWGGASLVFRIV